MIRSAESELRHLISRVEDRGLTAADAVNHAIGLKLGVLGIGGAVHKEGRKPGIAMRAGDGITLTGWRPRLTTEHGGAQPPVVRASGVGDTVVWNSAGGDFNVMYERPTTPGAAILPDNKWYDRGTFGFHFNQRTGLYEREGHPDLVLAIGLLPPTSVLGWVDFVEDDGSFTILIDNEPGHVASRREQATVDFMPVYAGEVQALLPEVRTSHHDYEPITL